MPPRKMERIKARKSVWISIDSPFESTGETAAGERKNLKDPPAESLILPIEKKRARKTPAAGEHAENEARNTAESLMPKEKKSKWARKTMKPKPKKTKTETKKRIERRVTPSRKKKTDESDTEDALNEIEIDPLFPTESNDDSSDAEELDSRVLSK